MDARKSLTLMSLIGWVPGVGLAIAGAMGAISEAPTALKALYGAAALIGLMLALLPLLIFSNIWPKTGGKSKTPAKAAKAAAVDKKAQAAGDEPASEEMDVAEDEDEFAAASDEFEAVSDDAFEFGEADEFDEEVEE